MSKSARWFLIVIAVLSLIALGFVILMFAVFSPPLDKTEVIARGSGGRIAVVELTGVINSSEDVVRQLKKYRENKSIKGILLRIDSPGGGVVASQEMYEEVRKTRDDGKPVVVSMGSVAASGGYYVAVGASRLVANRGTLTGSIGVISEFLQAYNALDKLGLEFKSIKSGRLKDAGTPMRKMTDADEKYFQGLMDDVHRQFIGVVERERNLEHATMLEIADGRVFTGEQALKLGLVDTLGTYEDAVTIAADLADIDGEPTLVKERKRRAGFWDAVFGDVAEGISDVKQMLIDRPMLSYRFQAP